MVLENVIFVSLLVKLLFSIPIYICTARQEGENIPTPKPKPFRSIYTMKIIPPLSLPKS
jgi:hypothetical protein